MWLPLQRPPLSAGIFCNLGKSPDWELNQRPFGQQAGAQSPEPHLLGPRLCSLMTHGQGAAHRDLSSAGCLGLPTPPGPRAERWAPPLQDCVCLVPSRSCPWGVRGRTGSTACCHRFCSPSRPRALRHTLCWAPAHAGHAVPDMLLALRDAHGDGSRPGY